MTTACVLDRPAPATLFQQLSDAFSTTVLGGGVIVPNSNEWWVIQNDYAAAELFFSIAEQQWKERDPRSACCDNLVAMAALDGIYPRPATYARGYVTLTGTAGVSLPNAIQVLFGSTYYQLDTGSVMPAVMPPSGSVTVRVASTISGTAGNGDTTSVSGRLITSITGVDQTVTVPGNAFCGGRDAEACEDFRLRYLARKRYKPRADWAWVSEAVTDWPCVTRILPRDCSCCPELGRLDAYVFADGSFANGIIPQDQLNQMTDWFFGAPRQGFGFGRAPWDMTGQFYAPIPVIVNIAVSNLPCTNADQLNAIRTGITGLFPTLSPGKALCRRLIDAIVIGVIGGNCDFDVTMSLGEGQQTSGAFCEDFTPACDELPVLGYLSVSGG